MSGVEEFEFTGMVFFCCSSNSQTLNLALSLLSPRFVERFSLRNSALAMVHRSSHSREIVNLTPVISPNYRFPKVSHSKLWFLLDLEWWQLEGFIRVRHARHLRNSSQVLSFKSGALMVWRAQGRAGRHALPKIFWFTWRYLVHNRDV